MPQSFCLTMSMSWPNPLPGMKEVFLIWLKFSTASKVSAPRKLTSARGEQGSLWQDESYDRIVRDEAEFLEKWQYIRNNPLKEGLASYPEDYPWLYEKGE